MSRLIQGVLVTGLTFLMGACGSDSSSVPDISSAPVTAEGLTISSNKLLSPYNTDFCTQYTGESCYFRGGQKVIFSDNSVLITAAWGFVYSAGGGDMDTDTNEHSLSIFIPPTTAASYQILSTFVARGAGYKTGFLYYDRATDTVSVVHDTDSSTTVSAGDTLLHTITQTSW